MWGNNKGVSAGLLPGRRFFGPLVLMAVTPLVALLIVRAVRHYDANMFVSRRDALTLRRHAARAHGAAQGSSAEAAASKAPRRPPPRLRAAARACLQAWLVLWC